VRSGLPDEADGLARVLSAAFHDDPAFTWLRGRVGDLRTLHGFFRALLRLNFSPGGAVDVAGDGLGVAVWAPPAAAPAQLSTWDELRLIPVFVAAVGWAGLGRMRLMRAAMDVHHIREPHWYLMFLGVDPAHQGQGCGSHLLKSRLARIDASGLPAYLETATARNVGLYARHGFEVIAEFRAAPEAPVMWAMRRPGRM
jgi:ribosomal protein S18 acetylase RimI-like enzyme